MFNIPPTPEVVNGFRAYHQNNAQDGSVDANEYFGYVDDYPSDTVDQYQDARIKELEQALNSLHESHISALRKIEIEKSLNEGIRFWDKQKQQAHSFILYQDKRLGKKAQEIRDRRIKVYDLILEGYLRRVFYAHPSAKPLPQVPMKRWKMAKILHISKYQLDTDTKYLVENRLVTKDDTPNLRNRSKERTTRLDGSKYTKTKFTMPPVRLGLPLEELSWLENPYDFVDCFDTPPPPPKPDPRFSEDRLIVGFLEGWTTFPITAQELYKEFQATLVKDQQAISGTKFGKVAARLLTRQHTKHAYRYLGKKQGDGFEIPLGFSPEPITKEATEEGDGLAIPLDYAPEPTTIQQTHPVRGTNAKGDGFEKKPNQPYSNCQDEAPVLPSLNPDLVLIQGVLEKGLFFVYDKDYGKYSYEAPLPLRKLGIFEGQAYKSNLLVNKYFSIKEDSELINLEVFNQKYGRKSNEDY